MIKLSVQKWLSNLAIYVNITGHLNEFDVTHKSLLTKENVKQFYE